MRTSEEIYHRVRWDPRFDPARFTFGVLQRGREPKLVPVTAFVPGGDIPWHRVLFVEADGQRVWDRESGLDALDATTAGRVRRERVLREPVFAARTPYAFDGLSGWIPAGEAVGAAPPARLRVLTWNTLWDKYDGHLIDTARRRPLLLAELARANADVIALQEVEPDLVDMILAERWVRASYTVDVPPRGPDVAASGVLLLSRLPIRESGRIALRPRKGVAAIVVDTAAGPLAVLATHLTSDHTEGGAGRRDEELARVREAVDGLGDVDTVLVGDFNDGGGMPARVLAMRDAWLDARPGDETATFDPVANPLAAVGSLRGLPARLDRIFLRAKALHVEAAELRGDVPVGGLFASDHYAVQADLSLGASTVDATNADVLDVRPTARTAVAWIPPEEHWPGLQDVRRRLDPSFDRWPPHVNVLFGFVPEAEFTRAVPLLAKALAATPAFAVRASGVRSFRHGDDHTVWLAPAAGDPGPWRALRESLVRHFPRCTGRAEGYTPHLTLGRTGEPGRVDAHGFNSRVRELAVLSRRGDEPMRVRATVELGTGRVTWHDDAGSVAVAGEAHIGERVRAHVAQALPDADVRLVGSQRLGWALAGADVDLVAAVPDPAAVRAIPGARDVRAVTGARVPGLKFRLHDRDVDLVLVPRKRSGDDAGTIAWSAVTDAEALLAEDAREMAPVARIVKAWARARGLDAAPFGGVPGIGWAVLTARASRGARPYTPTRFFETWAAWDWREPVAPHNSDAATGPGALTILTPTAPVRSCTTQVGADMRDLIAEELYAAWELLEAGRGLDALTAPPPMHRRHAAFLVVRVAGVDAAGFAEAHGRMRGRVRALLTALEEAGATGVHAWPRPFEASRTRAAYAIGLRAPGADQPLLEAAERWASGLSGVTVTIAAGGEVPTLR